MTSYADKDSEKGVKPFMSQKVLLGSVWCPQTLIFFRLFDCLDQHLFCLKACERIHCRSILFDIPTNVRWK